MPSESHSRFDLSSRLIHFVRPLNLTKSDTPDIPESFGWPNIHETDVVTPFFLLRCIIRHGRINATWAKRKKHNALCRTIYGRRPAVCLTEMPLAAFVQTSISRAARGEKISSFGVILPKDTVFALGGRPVIYGLSERPSDTIEPSGARVLPKSVLPLREQFRYAAYAPNSGPDWSHEREWRWPLLKNVMEPEDLPYGSWEDIPGLDFYTKGHFKNIGIIVESKRQAKLLVHDIVGLVDRKIADQDTIGYILKCEGLPRIGKLWRPENVQAAIEKNAIDLAPFFIVPKDEKDLVRRYQKLLKHIAQITVDVAPYEPGGCWLWFHDNTHPLVRSLLRAKIIRVSASGRYLASLDAFKGLSLRAKQKAASRIAKAVRRDFKTSSGYFSVLGSDDFDAVPFYCDSPLNDEIIFNYADR